MIQKSLVLYNTKWSLLCLDIKIETEMDIFYIKELIYKQISGSISEEEIKQLNSWKSANKSNERLFNELVSADFIIKTIQNPSIRKEAEESWNSVKKRIARRKSYPHLRIIWTSVACLLLLISTAIFWHAKNNNASSPVIIGAGTEKAVISLATGETMVMDDHTHTQFYALQKEERKRLASVSPDLCHTVTVPRGGEYKVVLEDGTAIHLNSESTLSIPADFSPQNRSVNLTGEAYFQVKSDQQHPFIVQTSKSEIIVSGTKFNVRNYPNETLLAVTLQDGEVHINSAYQYITLLPGEQGIVNSKGNIEIQKIDSYIACAWHQNRIVYENQPLVDILEDLGRWYNFEASFTNDSLRELRFSMDIDKTTDFNKVAEMMERMNKIKIKIERNNKCIITN